VLRALTILILCQFAGELTARALRLPLPGPVIGLVLLLVILMVRNGPDPALRDTSLGLLRNLSLLFVPAGVGIVTQLDVLAANWFPILVAIVVSTGLGLATTGWLMQRLSRAEPPDPAA
jgi:holin-like protein